MRVVWDLCSGLGGFSEAFIENEKYHVYRIDNNDVFMGIVPRTWLEDVTSWMDWVDDYPKPDIILASPPCYEFSTAFSAPKAKAQRMNIEYEPNMKIVQCILDIIDHVEPEIWIIENVKGAIEHFKKEPRLGNWDQRIGPFFFWGRFPGIAMLEDLHHTKKSVDPGKRDPLRANKRALIPYPISYAIYRMDRDQTSLLRWI
tara:strand:- start:84 stop:686 length:603 start_codon:yes stop_codon:yes gene_type:complete